MKVTPVTGTLANGIVLAVGGALALWSLQAPDVYYAGVQEDGPVEWATVWAFAAAAGLAVRELVARPGRLRLGLAAIALLCAFIAMEEISWGQRLIGYRPPVYFLEQNYQQELNVHNVANRSLRKLAVQGLIAGYGIALPLLCAFPAGSRLASQMGVVSPSPALIPAFAATLALYLWYPLRFTGEVVELMLGLCFLLTLLLRRPSGVLAALGATAAVAVLGIASAGLSATRSAAPELLSTTQRELEELAADLRALPGADDGGAVGCGVHKRLYTFVEQFGEETLRHGAFATGAGERGAYFLDPWNSPYWVRDRCADGGERRSVFVYSFGPNRARDSSSWEVRPDDLGVYLVRR